MRWLLVLLIALLTTSMARSKTFTHEVLNGLKPHVSITPLPAWVKAIPVQAEASFRAGQDRYLARQTAVRVDAQERVHRVYRSVVELRSPRHPWLQSGQHWLEPISFDAIDQAFELHAIKIHRKGRVVDITRVARRWLERNPASHLVPEDLSSFSVSFRLPRLHSGDQLELAYSLRDITKNETGHVTDIWHASLGEQHAGALPVVLESKVFQWAPMLQYRPVELARDAAAHSLAHHWVRTESVVDGWSQVAWTARHVEAMPSETMTIATVPNDWLTHDIVGVSRWAEGDDTLVQDFTENYLTSPAPSSAAYTALLYRLRKDASPTVRATAALRWVQQHIAYHLDRRRTPMSVDEVLKAGKGDCKDVSMLLWHLLRDMGIEAEVVGVYTSRGRWPSRLGTLAAFDHVVVVAWIGGNPYVLDGTLAPQASPLDRMGVLFPNHDLRIAHGPRKGYLRISSSPRTEDRERVIDRKTEFADDGVTITATLAITYTGAEAEYLRRDLGAANENARRNLFIARMGGDVDTGDEWLEPLSVQDDQARNRLTLSAKTRYRVKPELSPEGRHTFSFGSQAFYDRITDPGDVEQRINPLSLPFDHTSHAVATHTLILPKGWKADNGHSAEVVSHPAMRVTHARRTNTQDGRVVVVDRLELELKGDRVHPSDFPAYKAAVKKTQYLPAYFRFGP